jgi:hypothetical protein
MKSKSFNAVRLEEARNQMKFLKTEIAELVLVVKQEKLNMAEARQIERERKAAMRAAKQADRIAKLEARLARMKSPKKPSKVKVYTGAEAQALAA